MSDSHLIATTTVLVVAAYLLGSIPFGFIIGLIKGVDVRNHGSGNIGATNVARLLGKKYGYICFLLDVAKGLLPVLFAGRCLRGAPITDGVADQMSPPTQIAWLCVAAACILGHMFSAYLRFRGGKGVATSLGVVLGIYPYFTLAAVFAFAIWIAVWGMWRYVSLASIAAAIAFPVGFGLWIWRVDKWTIAQLWPLLAFACIVATLVVFRHRSNIARLLDGSENQGKTQDRKVNDEA